MRKDTCLIGVCLVVGRKIDMIENERFEDFERQVVFGKAD